LNYQNRLARSAHFGLVRNAVRRRDLLAAVAAIGLAPAARAFAAEGDLAAAAREAWIFALPLIEMASIRSGARGRPNQLHHTRMLITPAERRVTAPNNDTLFSEAWLDLTRGPLVLRVPPTGSRYMSVQIMNMYTDVDATLSRRTIGDQGGLFTIIGPGQPDSGENTVRLSTPHGWMLVRTLVDGPADLPAAHGVQDGLQLSGPSVEPPGRFADRHADAAAYFAAAAALMAADPPRSADTGLLDRIAPLGLTAKSGFDSRALTPAQWKNVEAGVVAAKAQMMSFAAGQQYIDGWTYPKANVGAFGQDYLFRANVALVGIGANTPAEAMYMHPRGEDRRNAFNGDGLYRLSLEATPPVDGFWSLTMYELTSEGQRFLTENPINRYSIGDRTPGLKRRADGGLDLWIGRSDPGGDRTANWLPAPSKGPFFMSMRAYWPKAELRDGRYRLPPISLA